MTKSCEQLEIDTKDMCLMCLGSKNDINCLDSLPTLHSLQGLKHLLRYLKVSPKELFNCSSEFLQSMEIQEDIDLKISLCSKCSSVTEKFNKLYQDYEFIQLQFSDCVQRLHESISTGNENLERVRKYKDQMRPTKSADLVNASIAANLRNETLKKCSLKLQSEVSTRVAIENPNLETYLNTPKPEEAEVVYPTSSETVSFKHEANLGPDNHPSNTPVKLQLDDACFQTDAPDSECSLLTSTEPIFDTEVIPKITSVKTLVKKTPSYFNSIRKKFKTTSQPHPTAAASTSNFPSRDSFSESDNTLYETCTYCKTKYSQKSLAMHMSNAHPYHFISKFLPSSISPKLCKQEVYSVWEQMFQVSHTQCQFCMAKLYHKSSLKRHLLGSHAEQMAIKVSEKIQSLPESEVIPNDDGNNVEISPESSQESLKPRFACEYCNCTYTSKLSLRQHKTYMHPEHFLHKYFPPHTPLESCRQGVDAVLKQMKQSSGHGFKCKFCTKNVLNFKDFKRHAVTIHAEQIAVEVQQGVGVFPEHLEGVSTNACSSTGENYVYENKYDVSESEDVDLSMPVEMDFEFGEELIKIENEPSENVELDPLDEN